MKVWLHTAPVFTVYSQPGARLRYCIIDSNLIHYLVTVSTGMIYKWWSLQVTVPMDNVYWHCKYLHKNINGISIGSVNNTSVYIKLKKRYCVWKQYVNEILICQIKIYEKIKTKLVTTLISSRIYLLTQMAIVMNAIYVNPIKLRGIYSTNWQRRKIRKPWNK